LVIRGELLDGSVEEELERYTVYVSASLTADQSSPTWLSPEVPERLEGAAGAVVSGEPSLLEPEPPHATPNTATPARRRAATPDWREQEMALVGLRIDIEKRKGVSTKV
jgi:hypothetical protein